MKNETQQQELMINTIHNENCLDTMARMEDNFVDLTITSPPYDNLRTYNGYSFPFEDIAKELYRITKDGGIVVWVVGDATIKGSESGTSFRQALFFMECGFRLHDTMIYQKQSYVPLTHNRYEQEFEYMFIFSKGKPRVFNPIKIPCKYAGTKTWGDSSFHKTNNSGLINVGRKKINDFKQSGNIFKYVPSRVKSGHPAPFPEKLAEDHIISWSTENDIVYDPFAGSGTTAKMSILNNRNWIASEVSSEYCEIIKQRIESI